MIDPTVVDTFLPKYLARQPWFAHGSALARLRSGQSVEVQATVRHRELWRDGDPGLVWAIVDASFNGVDVGSYQVIVGMRPSVPSPGFLIGATSRILGTFAGDGSEWVAYDALADPALTAAALQRMFDDLHDVHSVRKLTAGKTSTSVVADEAWLCKVFRRVHDGDNPGVEMPATLWRHGFTATLETVESWHHADMDLALRRPYLPGAANGFALAEASLRELFASGLDPRLSPGDFSAEARRIGQMLADMHRASRDAYGLEQLDATELISEVAADVVDLGLDGLDRSVTDDWASRCLARLGSMVGAIRVHGNLHLGQLLRSDRGWLVLDFEGAPLLPTAQRRRPRPAYFDVASMLRSFDYVAAMTSLGRVDPTLLGDVVSDGAAQWVSRNSEAFLDGYRHKRGDAASDLDVLVEIGQVARAAYEVAYERANRPDMVAIPESALRGLLAR